MEEKPIAPRLPWQNPDVERLIGMWVAKTHRDWKSLICTVVGSALVYDDRSDFYRNTEPIGSVSTTW